jgi:hypothetical protein
MYIAPAAESEINVNRSKVMDEDFEKARMDYDDKTEVTEKGKLRRSDCGKLFDTLEELKKHHRKAHNWVVDYVTEQETRNISFG